jgi:hypothetical protein
MILNINCRYNDRGAWCLNKTRKRSLAGIGARVCFKYEHPNGQCADQEPYPKPKATPPPPPKPPAKRIIAEDIFANKIVVLNTSTTAIDVLAEAREALEIAMSVYHMGEGLVVEKDAEASEKIQKAGGYLAYLASVAKEVDKMHQSLTKLKG